MVLAELYRDLIAHLHYWLTIFQKTHTFNITRSAMEMIGSLWYWFLGSLAIAATLTTFVSPSRLTKQLKALRGWDLLIASILGLISPLGTYAVIPVVAVLISAGAPLAPLVTFLISSPLMNPSIFLLTAGGMCLDMALARVISTLVLSLSAGWIVRRLEKDWKIPDDVLHRTVDMKPRVPLRHHKKALEGLKSHRFQRIIEGNSENIRTWLDNFRGQIFFAGRYFLFAIIVSALIKEFVPPYVIARAVGQNARYSVMISAALGVPFYTCGGAAIPLMRILSNQGMDKGAILAFFITGPATNLSTIFTMGALFKPRFLIIYYIATLGGAILMGYLYKFM